MDEIHIPIRLEIWHVVGRDLPDKKLHVAVGIRVVAIDALHVPRVSQHDAAGQLHRCERPLPVVEISKRLEIRIVNLDLSIFRNDLLSSLRVAFAAILDDLGRNERFARLDAQHPVWRVGAGVVPPDLVRVNPLETPLCLLDNPLVPEDGRIPVRPLGQRPFVVMVLDAPLVQEEMEGLSHRGIHELPVLFIVPAPIDDSGVHWWISGAEGGVLLYWFKCS